MQVVRPALAGICNTARPRHGSLFARLSVSSADVSAVTRDTATLPLALGGLGLRSTTLTSLAAFYAKRACRPLGVTGPKVLGRSSGRGPAEVKTDLGQNDIGQS